MLVSARHLLLRSRNVALARVLSTTATTEGPLRGKLIEKVQASDFASSQATISDEKIRAFASLTGDLNPIHLDDEAARACKLERRIAHGMLVASAIPTLFANCFPLCVYRNQELQFVQPVYVGDVVKTTITVLTLTPVERKQIVVAKCDTRCQVHRGDKWVDVIKGSAEVIVPNST